MTTLPAPPQFITSIIYQLSKFNTPPTTDNNTTTSPNNPLSRLPPPIISKVKPLLLTLHCLFPNELLLALDILDRKMIKRYIPRRPTTAPNHLVDTSINLEQQQQQGTNNAHPDPEPSPLPSDPQRAGAAVAETETEPRENPDDQVYFIRSSSSSTNPSRPGTTTTQAQERHHHYMVCLNAWNCSCPAFTLAAFRDLDLDLAADSSRTELEEGDYYGAWDSSSRRPMLPFGGTLAREEIYGPPPVCKHLLASMLGSQCPALFGGGIEEVSVGEQELAGRYAGWGG
ncbi:hypothetical protein FQN50_007894 [Emmonsiellopsis sp. PD_5]|nr:hypothetical protein FQN50_007894 [Emmonsiellopsis sp. PD_5]